MTKEIKVSCPDCNDQFHTNSKINEMESCTICNEVFIIEESDVVYTDNSKGAIYNHDDDNF